MAHDDDHLKQIWMRLSGQDSEVSKQADEIPKEFQELSMPGETMEILDTLTLNTGSPTLAITSDGEKRTQLSVLHAAEALCNHQNLIRHLACRG